MDPVLLQEETEVPGEDIAVLGGVKLDNTLLTCDHGKLNHTTACMEQESNFSH